MKINLIWMNFDGKCPEPSKYNLLALATNDGDANHNSHNFFVVVISA